MPPETCNNTDHVVLLQKLDRMILVAEESEYDQGFRKRLQAFRNLLVIHAAKTKNLGDAAAAAKEMVRNHKRKILIAGAAVVSAIVVPYFVITRTTWLMSKPIGCKEFPTTSYLYPGKIEVCLNGVTRAYSLHNGDVELDLTFMRSPTERVQADVVFWVADKIGEKEVDYSGEYNIDRVRIYENGILVSDKKEKLSGWMHPLVPADVRMPMWEYVHSMRGRYHRDKPPLEEVLQGFVDRAGAIFAALGSIGVTAYRFFRVGRGI